MARERNDGNDILGVVIIRIFQRKNETSITEEQFVVLCTKGAWNGNENRHANGFQVHTTGRYNKKSSHKCQRITLLENRKRLIGKILEHSFSSDLQKKINVLIFVWNYKIIISGNGNLYISGWTVNNVIQIIPLFYQKKKKRSLTTKTEKKRLLWRANIFRLLPIPLALAHYQYTFHLQMWIIDQVFTKVPI